MSEIPRAVEGENTPPTASGPTAQKSQENVPSPLDLGLVNRKVPIRFCEYKVNNQPGKMLTADSQAISPKGVLFLSPVAFGRGTLMRIWVELPEYWTRKSRHVDYRHTEAPTHFQILARVINTQEMGKRNNRVQHLCQVVNIDAVDEKVLQEYLED